MRAETFPVPATAVLAVFGLLGWGPAPREAPPVPAAAQEACTATAGQRVLDLVNAERRERGLPPYEADTLLAEAARIHAEDMSRTGVPSHDGSDGSDPSQRLDAVGYPWIWVGENVAAGQDEPGEVVGGWMRSEAHRNNVLHDSFTSAGVALARSDAGGYGTFWVMVYATADPPSPSRVRCHP